MLASTNPYLMATRLIKALTLIEKGTTDKELIISSHISEDKKNAIIKYHNELENFNSTEDKSLSVISLSSNNSNLPDELQEFLNSKNTKIIIDISSLGFNKGAEAYLLGIMQEAANDEYISEIFQLLGLKKYTQELVNKILKSVEFKRENLQPVGNMAETCYLSEMVDPEITINNTTKPTYSYLESCINYVLNYFSENMSRLTGLKDMIKKESLDDMTQSVANYIRSYIWKTIKIL